MSNTLPELFSLRVQRSAPRAAVFVRQEGKYAPTTWLDFARDVRRLAAGLLRSGVAPGDRIIQFSENRYEWLVVDLAIQLAQAVHVPVHAPLTGSQAAFQIVDSGSRIVFLSTEEQAAKLRELVDSHDASLCSALPQLRFYAFSDSIAPLGNQPVRSWRELMPAITDREGEEIERQAVASAQPESLATILYTSGTTGEPKGVMLTQNNMVSNAVSVVEQFSMLEEDRRLTFLPLSHIFARLCDMYTWVAAGYQLALAGSRETVLADCADYHPTVLNGVPYFFDRARRFLIDSGKADQPGALAGLLGGDIRLCCSGGAALPDHVFDFYWEQKVPLLQGYGLTETSPVISMSTLQHYRRSSSGIPIRDVEVRIAEDGEIITRGPHVMVGYYRQPAATAEVIRDGWFYTGDLGRIDEDGFVYITGRKKEILVTSGGKNIAPVQLESLLTEDPLILQAVVVGDDRDYLAALIVPNPETLRQAIIQSGIVVSSREEALVHPQVLALYEERIRERLKGVSYYEQIRKFRLMNRGFTIESGELTPKLSLRRKVIEANCREIIDELYQRTST